MVFYAELHHILYSSLVKQAHCLPFTLLALHKYPDVTTWGEDQCSSVLDVESPAITRILLVYA